MTTQNITPEPMFKRPRDVAFYLNDWMTAQGMPDSERAAELQRIANLVWTMPQAVAEGLSDYAEVAAEKATRTFTPEEISEECERA